MGSFLKDFWRFIRFLMDSLRFFRDFWRILWNFEGFLIIFEGFFEILKDFWYFEGIFESFVIILNDSFKILDGFFEILKRFLKDSLKFRRIFDQFWGIVWNFEGCFIFEGNFERFAIILKDSFKILFGFFEIFLKDYLKFWRIFDHL